MTKWFSITSLSDGVTKTMNATFLMKKMGII